MVLRRLWIALLSIVLLCPAGYFAWRYASMPQLGVYHDDAIYWVSAKSLAQTGEYRIPSLPGSPYATKYPPLYPAWLSLAWRWSPTFPANLPLALGLHWLLLPLLLWTTRVYLGRAGLSDRWAWILTALVILNPMTVIFATSFTSELMFAVLVTGALCLLERDPAEPLPLPYAVGAGACVAAGILTRSNGVALLGSALLVLAWRRQWRSAVAFAVFPVTAVVGWRIWMAQHPTPGSDVVSLYYLDYLGFYKRYFQWEEFPVQVWSNFNAILTGQGRLVLFSITEDMLYRMLTWLLSAAAYAGLLRLARTTGRWQGPALVAPCFLLLLVWNFPADTRFLYPLLPLLLLGLLAQGQYLWPSVQLARLKPERSERIAGRIMGGIIVSGAAGIALTTLYGIAFVLPAYFSLEQARVNQMEPAYTWIRTHTPPDAKLFAYDDVLLYLRTGRQAISAPVLPHAVYSDSDELKRAYLQRMPEVWQVWGLTGALTTTFDFRRDFQEAGLAGVRQALSDARRFPVLVKEPKWSVYGIPEPATVSHQRQ